MREKVLYAVGLLAIVLLAWNLPAVSELPVIPLAAASFLAVGTALVGSLGFLATRQFRYDALAVASTEVGLTFLAATIVTGCLEARAILGVWWAWDPRMTTALIGWLLYATYLMLRQAVSEPTQRATFSAVWSVFIFIDLPIMVCCVAWWRHQPVSRWVNRNLLSRASVVYLLAMILVGIVLAAIRMRQEEARRELDSLRRMTHAM